MFIQEGLFTVHCLLIKENLNLKSYLCGSKMGKNRNQHVHTGGLVCRGAYMRGSLYEGGLIRGVTQVLRKR